jgi:ParB-like chromosome segregation protein Spo0J
MRLAEMDTPLPPILVDRLTMRVIDGMHRLMAASLRGRDTIDVVFFDGSEADMFLRAVQENITHGLPLSQADRRAAAERIIASHPDMSDRAVGQVAGLAAKTVATMRKRSTDNVLQLSGRVGMDGKVRPLDYAEGRKRAAEVLTQQPEASLRDVARAAGVSPATALDVRKRLERGEVPAPGKPKAAAGVVASGGGANNSSLAWHSGLQPAFRSSSTSQHPAATVEKLLRDPSLRDNEQGKGMLRLLHVNAVGAEQLPDVAAAVPPHCVSIVVQLARQYAKMWQDFARELDGRARIIDPLLSAVLPADIHSHCMVDPHFFGGGTALRPGHVVVVEQPSALGDWGAARPRSSRDWMIKRVAALPGDTLTTRSVVPHGNLFVLGDNRDASIGSPAVRFLPRRPPARHRYPIPLENRIHLVTCESS